MSKSSSFTHAFLTLILVFISIFQSSAQSPAIPAAIKGKKPLHIEKVNAKPGEIVQRITLRNGTTKDIIIDPTEQLSLIVELKDEPLFMQQIHSAGSAIKRIDPHIHLNQFRSDLTSLHQSLSATTKLHLAAPVIVREFSKVFSGAAVKVPRAMLGKIAALSYVKKVHINKQVHASLEQSVHQIRADSVWSKLGSQGDSVIVGEIDTGIDYADSALGGGFGPGHKVIGGYNLIDTTALPMDDNGHGTHVAGIIAANGMGLHGVAPHAKLMAFKVLDQYGSGTEDEVIGGIERAVDPNNDGNTKDHVDIANMSLGGYGDPDDAMSTAVDNAVRLGVVFCIAAGNAGSGDTFNSIESPGTARSALTVGAVDSNDVIAYFSSRGPNTNIYSIKPEIVAPGVNILSTYLNNSTESMSGTSMATPHITGVCALLKSLHHNWTPLQIKSAVMSSAVNTGSEVMVQGAGRVDALNAALVTAFVVPSPLSFGLDNNNVSTWNIADTVWISNRALQSQSFQAAFDGVQSGITLTASPSSFTVAQNDSQQVIVSLSVDNSVVPYPQQGSLALSGQAHFNGSIDTLNIPWAFVKAARVIVTSDIPTEFIFVSNSFFNVYDATPTVEFICPKGVYDLVTSYYPQGFDVKEQLAVNGNASFSISSTDASNLVTANGIGNVGQPLNSMIFNSNVTALIFPDSSMMVGWLYFGGPDSMLHSNFSNRFTLYQAQSATDGSDNYYNVQFSPLRGLNQNVVLTNNANDLHSASIVAKFPPSGYGDILYIHGIFGNGNNGPWGEEILEYPELSKTHTGLYTGKMFFTKDFDPNVRFLQLLAGMDSSMWQGDWFEAPSPRIIDDSIGFFNDSVPPVNKYVVGNGDSITVGYGPMYTSVGTLNNFYGKSNIYISPLFFGQLDESKGTTYYRSSYHLYDSQGINVSSDSTIAYFEPINVPLDTYRFIMTNNDYYINRYQGHAILTAQFDLRKPDADPPQFTSLRVLNKNGRPTDMLSTGEHGIVEFSSADYRLVIDNQNNSAFYQYQSINTDSTQLFFRKNGTTNWDTLLVSKIVEDTTSLGVVYEANLSSTTQYDSAGIDLKFHIVDLSGNSSEWVLEPAFGVGKFIGTNPIITGVNKTNNTLPTTYALRQNYPNPFNPSTVISYQLPKSGLVSLKVYDLLGREVATLVNETKSAGNYTVTFNAINLSSGVYFYRLQAGNFNSVKKLILLK